MYSGKSFKKCNSEKIFESQKLYFGKDFSKVKKILKKILLSFPISNRVEEVNNGVLKAIAFI